MSLKWSSYSIPLKNYKAFKKGHCTHVNVDVNLDMAATGNHLKSFIAKPITYHHHNAEILILLQCYIATVTMLCVCVIATSVE